MKVFTCLLEDRREGANVTSQEAALHNVEAVTETALSHFPTQCAHHGGGTEGMVSPEALKGRKAVFQIAWSGIVE